jgi:nucleotide-binding universal stress UspA family protein
MIDTDEDAPVTIKRILVPMDFSTHALQALAYARQVAERFDAELLLVHVIEPAYRADASDVYVTGPHGAVLFNEQQRLAQAQLRRLGADLTKHGHRVRSMVKRGSPPQAIVDTAARVGAHLIVMGTWGRTGLSRMLIGSVAERVVRTAGCPVLTVRRPLPARRALTRTGRKESGRQAAK